jgi:hypothetical protein
LPGWACFGDVPEWALPIREQQVDTLKTQAGWLKQQLDAISQRLSELGKGSLTPMQSGADNGTFKLAIRSGGLDEG